MNTFKYNIDDFLMPSEDLFKSYKDFLETLDKSNHRFFPMWVEVKYLEEICFKVIERRLVNLEKNIYELSVARPVKYWTDYTSFSLNEDELQFYPKELIFKYGY